MTVIEAHTGAPEQLAATATGPARCLLEMASVDGVPLTQTNALARTVVREIAERWPEWWNAELFGPPHRELDMPLVGALHEGLRRRRLVRRRARKLLITARGRKLAADPITLLYDLGLDLGGGDPFTAMVASVLVEELEENSRVPVSSSSRRRTRRRSGAGAGPTGAHPASSESPGLSGTSSAEARRTDWSTTSPTQPSQRAGAR